MSKPIRDDAPALVMASGPVGDLVRRYDAELLEAADEPRAWLRLDAELSARPTRAWRFPVALLLTTGALSLAAVLLYSWHARAPEGIAPTAEVFGHSEAKQNRSAAAPPVSLPAPSASAAKGPTTKPAPSAEQASCDALVKAQAFGRAAACYEHRAQGSGLDAELALYELARLRLNALGDAAGAARACELYRARFPGGSFRAQIDRLWQRADAASKPAEVEKSGSGPEGDGKRGL